MRPRIEDLYKAYDTWDEQWLTDSLHPEHVHLDDYGMKDRDQLIELWPSVRSENNDFTRDRVTLIDNAELSAFSFTHVAETGLEKHTHCLLKKDGMYWRTMIHRQPLGDD